MVCVCGLAGRNNNRNTNIPLLHDGCVKLLQWINKWKDISLPTTHGGLGINVSSLTEGANTQHRKCAAVTKDLKNKLMSQDYTLPIKQDLKELRKLQEQELKKKQQEQASSHNIHNARVHMYTHRHTRTYLSLIHI